MTSNFLAHVKRKRPTALVHKFLRDLESGLFETPRSFDVISQFRTEELKLSKAGQRLRVSFPESPLIHAFCKRYPQAKQQPISLSSFEPPLAKQFALKQLKLMTEERLPQDAAFARVEQELMPQLLALTQRGLGSSVSQMHLTQQEENSKLQEALQSVADGKLPVRLSQGTADSSSLQFGGRDRRRRPKPQA